MPSRHTATSKKVVSHDVPEHMKAAAVDRFGPPSVLTLHEVPVPKPGPREVLIAIEARCWAGSCCGLATTVDERNRYLSWLRSLTRAV